MGAGESEATGERMYLGLLNKSQKDERKEARNFDKEQDKLSKHSFHGEMRMR